jgi:hypothetical protein
MFKSLVARFSRRQQQRSPVKFAALKAFCVVRHAQRKVAHTPALARSVMQDVSDAWRESARIVPND